MRMRCKTRRPESISVGKGEEGHVPPRLEVIRAKLEHTFLITLILILWEKRGKF